ncbi:hypothetical protein H6778_00260 [Candidatus Nomurabacteria bacterium]|nr:hypothetical protein [Candidatus Nomurabacteria bacterium]
MNRYVLIGLVWMLFVAVSPVQAHAVDDPVHRAELEQQIAVLLKLIAELQAQLATLQNTTTDAVHTQSAVEIELGYEGSYRAQYEVERGGELSLMSGVKDRQDAELWQLFRTVAGEEFALKNVRELWLFESELSSLAAFVAPRWREAPSWVVAINVEDIDLRHEADLYYVMDTFTHETAHLHSLGEDEADLTYDPSRCRTFFAEYVCLHRDAYLYDFITAFWDDDALAYASNTRAFDEYYEQQAFIEAYYDQHPNSFVSTYAATNPLEDLAESFTVFVLASSVEGDTIAHEKVNFFNEYPVLVKLRQEMRERQQAYIRKHTLQRWSKVGW